ncbi:hypothetical protein [Paenibacillus chitinolyticus]|uniref:hypothetical protein n=1 Tax=Paenibacillus chitinolyticus TaxID=79263 RepID=UPI001C4591BE|nr:hypothetical protein [Paenibacillus chitinolyticus]MBV6717165.1 hypothetical protein [Paenibacillus chitinolyticus]
MLIHKILKESFPVSFLQLHPYDVTENMKGWEEEFDWTIYFDLPGFEVYKMVIKGNDDIQGAIALERKADHVFVHLIESAPWNRDDKVFERAGLNLMAFACKRSKDLGHEGFVSFQSKTRIIQYYEKNMFAQHIGGGNMIISDVAANRLIELYLTEG